MASQDDSAGSYGTWSNPTDQSWLDWLKMKAADVQQGGHDLELGMLHSLSPYGEQGWQVPPAISDPANAFYRVAPHVGRTGPFGPSEQDKADLGTLALTFGAGNALNPLAAIPEGSLASNPGIISGALRQLAKEDIPEPAVSPKEAFYSDSPGGFAPNAPRDYIDALLQMSDPEWKPSILHSDTGRPSLMGSALAGSDRSAPIRAYHGAPNSFDKFNTPTVFMSTDPARASDYAGSSGSVLPLDISPKSVLDAHAFMDSQEARTPRHSPYVEALNNGHDFIDWGGGTYQAVQPGTVKSATTGETLFSDQKPSLMGSALAGAEHDGPTLAAPNVNIYDPPYTPKRAFEDDYPLERFPNGPKVDERGRLLEDINGNPLNPDARWIVGRQMGGGGNKALWPSEFDALTEALTGGNASFASPSEMGPRAGATVVDSASGRPVRVLLRPDLSPGDESRVYAHELGHVIDRTAVPGMGIPTSSNDPFIAPRLHHEFGQIYHDLNNPDDVMRGLEVPPHAQYEPGRLGYPPEKWDAEYIAEALRAYLTDPGYIKDRAPLVAERLRKYVNGHPDLNSIIQLNSGGMPSLWPSALQDPNDPHR